MGRGRDYFLLGLAKALESGTLSYLSERDRRERLALAERGQADTDAYRQQLLALQRQRLAQQGELSAQRAADYGRQVDLQEQGLDLRRQRQAMLEQKAQEKLAAPQKLPANNAAANAIYAARQAAGPGAPLSEIQKKLEEMGYGGEQRIPTPPELGADPQQSAIYEQRMAEYQKRQSASEAIRRWLNEEQGRTQKRSEMQPHPLPQNNLMPPGGMAPGAAPRETWGGQGSTPPGAPMGMLEQPRMPPIDEVAFAQAPQGPNAGPMAQSLMGSWARNFNIGMGLVPASLTEYLEAWAWLSQNVTGAMPEHLQLMLNGPGGAPDMGGGVL